MKGYPQYECESFSMNLFTFTRRRMETAITKIATWVQTQIKISIRLYKGDVPLYRQRCVRYPPSHIHTQKNTHTQTYEHKFIHVPIPTHTQT